MRRPIALLAVATLLAGAGPLLTAAPAGAAIGDITTFGDPAENINSPGRIITGPDGNLWFTSQNASLIGRITTAGVITTFADPDGLPSTNNPFGLTVGPDGNLWYANIGNDRIGRLDPDAGNNAAIAASMVTFPDPGGVASTDAPVQITAGPDGNLWYTAQDSDTIGRITPAGLITTFADPAGTASTNTPGGITVGPDGNIWYSSISSDRIGRLDPDAGSNAAIAASMVTFPDAGGAASTDGPRELITGPDGDIWYTSTNNDRIGHLDPAAGSNAAIAASITTFADPGGTASTNAPRGIIVGPDGKIWYAAQDSDTIGRFDPLAADPAATITTFTDPLGPTSTDGPFQLTTGPDNNVWFTGRSTIEDRIGRVATARCRGQVANVALALGDAVSGGPDVVAGTAANETIETLGGSDVVCGGGGNDTINGGLGNDVLDGAGGNDTVDGAQGSDQVLGAAGNDTLIGQAGNDRLTGGKGNDTLSGGTNRDTCAGQAGNDTATSCEIRSGIP